MSKLVDIKSEEFWQVLFDEACVEGRQAERIENELDKISVDEKEIRAKAIDEFAEKMKERLKGMQMVELQGEDVCPCAESGEECPYMNQDVGCQYCAREYTIKEIDEITEELKGVQE